MSLANELSGKDGHLQLKSCWFQEWFLEEFLEGFLGQHPGHCQPFPMAFCLLLLSIKGTSSRTSQYLITERD